MFWNLNKVQLVECSDHCQEMLTIFGLFALITANYYLYLNLSDSATLCLGELIVCYDLHCLLESKGAGSLLVPRIRKNTANLSSYGITFMIEDMINSIQF